MTVLGEIIDGVREDLEQRRARVDLEQMKERAAAAAPARSFTPEQFGLICEVKRSSPSKGALADIADPAELAAAYEAGGAAAISVLTEERRFGGSLEDFAAVRARVDVPLLRKDFMVDMYQVYEARTWGADCILLIVSALEDQQLADLSGLAMQLGLDVLVEVHDIDELERAVQVPVPLVGINNRNLRTFEVSLQTTLDMRAAVPRDRVLVTESGIVTASDVQLMRSNGVNAFLVGETFMRAPEPGEALRQLFFAHD